VVACLVALAQAQAPQPPPFRSGVSLVTVDVTVLDADGRPVPGLTAADFEVRLNNRVQSIRAVEYLQVAETMAGAVGPSFDAAPLSAPAKGASTVPRVFLLLVDDLSFSPLAGKDLFAAARRFVSALTATDFVGVATTTGTVVVNPTADRAPILAALPKIAGAFQDPRVASSGPAEGKNASPDQQVGLAQALDIDRGDSSVLKQAIVNECLGGDTRVFNAQSVEQLLATNTCARQVQLSAMRTAAQMKMTVQRQAQAYESVIRAMRAAAGIRHLVILTDGVALSQDITTMTPVARAAAEAGVQLSVLMTTPDTNMNDVGRRPPPPGSAQPQLDTGAPQRRREDNQLFLNGARTTADMAGGEFYQITGAPDRFFERVRTAASAIYRIAVEAPADTQPGKDFTLATRVLKRQDVTARANRHAVAAVPAAAATAPAPSATPRALVPPAEQMRRAIASGQALTGVDVSLERSVRRAANPAQVSIDVVIGVSAAAKAPLHTIFGLVDAGGAIRTSDRTIESPDPNGGYRLAFSVPVAPGAYKLRFAAADASGAVGAAESAVDATLTSMGPLQASGIAVEPLAGSRRGILAAIELYPPTGGAPADVIVKMALMSGTEPAVERVIVPEAIDGVLRAEAEFLLDALPPGSYAIRVTVVSGTAVLGTTTRPLHGVS
jgi:VWFA-related protein